MQSNNTYFDSLSGIFESWFSWILSFFFLLLFLRGQRTAVYANKAAAVFHPTCNQVGLNHSPEKTNSITHALPPLLSDSPPFLPSPPYLLLLLKLGLYMGLVYVFFSFFYFLYCRPKVFAGVSFRDCLFWCLRALLLPTLWTLLQTLRYLLCPYSYGASECLGVFSSLLVRVSHCLSMSKWTHG